MAETKRVELECVTCKSWIPFAIHLVESNSGDSTIEVDRILRCPACRALAPFRPERMRLLSNDAKGGFGAPVRGEATAMPKGPALLRP